MNIRRLTLLISAFLLLFCACIIGNLVSLGERISGMSAALGVAYYVLVGAVFVGCIIVPVFRVILTPEIKGDLILDAEKRYRGHCEQCRCWCSMQGIPAVGQWRSQCIHLLADRICPEKIDG